MSLDRQHQFGLFLRACRERLTPQDVGLPNGGRRRTPGLRREEVALLAGVSVTWYTRLEQGRDVTPSSAVIESLARVLRLEERERQHLLALQLAHRPLPPLADPDPVLGQVVTALDPNPAYLVNARGDRLAWNRSHSLLLGDPTGLPDDSRNLYWLLFTDPGLRAMVRDWRRLALAMLADYRAAAVTHPGDPAFESLTHALRATSRDFRQWWDADAVADFQPAHWQFDHPQLGFLQLDYRTLTAVTAPDIRLVVALPADAATRDRFASATTDAPTPRALSRSGS